MAGGLRVVYESKRVVLEGVDPRSVTVGQLKGELARLTSIAPGVQWLVTDGKVLEPDSAVLADAGVSANDATVFLFVPSGPSGEELYTPKPRPRVAASPVPPHRLMSGAAFDDLPQKVDIRVLLGSLNDDAVAMLQRLLDYPDHLRRVIESSPVITSNWEIQKELANPEFMAKVANPRLMESVLQVYSLLKARQQRERATGTGAGTGPAARPQAQAQPQPQQQLATPDTAAANDLRNAMAAALGAFFNNAGAGAATAPAQPAAAAPAEGAQPQLDLAAALRAALAQQMMQYQGQQAGVAAQPPVAAPPPVQPARVAPVEQYAAQLAMLRDMGFYDEGLNLTAITRAQGDVDMAVEYLMNLMEG